MKRTQLLTLAAAAALILVGSRGALGNVQKDTGASGTSSGTTEHKTSGEHKATTTGPAAGTSSGATTGAGTTDRSGMTTSGADTAGAEDKANQARSTFLEKTDKQLDQIDEKVASMKKDLDSKQKSSAMYRQQAVHINAIQGKMKEARDNLKLVEDVPAASWQELQPIVEKNVSELTKMAERKVAE